MSLYEKHCVECRDGAPALTTRQIAELTPELKNWQVVDGKKLVKNYTFDNFAKSMALANKIADIAESENHHPDLLVAWGKLRIDLWTHAVDGLSENDFILAARIDCLTAE